MRIDHADVTTGIELTKQYIVVEKLAKKDKKYKSMIELRDVGFTDYNIVCKLNDFLHKSIDEDENVVDCYYNEEQTLYVISVDLESQIIDDIMEINKNQWTFNFEDDDFHSV